MTRHSKPSKITRDISRQESRLYFSRAYERPHQAGRAKHSGDASPRLGAVKIVQNARCPSDSDVRRARIPGEVETRLDTAALCPAQSSWA
jgi:hypothetical protein